LLDKGRLEKYTALNISERENLYSDSLMPDDLKPNFEIKLMSFDDLLKEGNFKEGTDFFDVVISTDSMIHSVDKKLLVQTVAKLVAKGGIFYFSDYLSNPDSDPEKLKILNERFHPSDLYNFKGYEEAFAETEMQKIWTKNDTLNFRKHVGTQYYLLTGELKDKLICPQEGLSYEFYNKVKVGLMNWIKYSAEGVMQWGHLLYKKDIY
jgi:sarcosine/dimethylglycine N-methyltransferase